MNTALIMLRAFQQNISLEDMAVLEVGELTDIIVESGNDSYEYPIKGTEDDYRRLFGV